MLLYFYKGGIKVEENKVKGKNNMVLIVVIVILLVAVLGLGSYVLLNRDNSSSTKYVTGSNNTDAKNENSQKDSDKNANTNTDKNANTNTETNTQQTNTNSTIIFDASKSVNSSEKNYTLSCQGNAGIWVTVDSTQKTLNFSYTPTKVVEFYPLTWTSTRNDVISSDINFSKKIVDVFFGGMGQSSSGDTLFILLEDGTVEYIPIVHMLNHVQAAVVSYGEINGVNDVAKFTLASTTGGVTTLAIKNDGSFYDLWYALKDTGNY